MIKKKKQLIKQIKPEVYPTAQIFDKTITVEEYIVSISNDLACEILERRMEIKTLPLFAELALVLKKLGELKYYEIDND